MQIRCNVLLAPFLSRFWSPRQKEKDPWDGSSGYFVADLRTELDRISEHLRSRGSFQRADTRFNQDKECAEIFCGHDVLARVSLREDIIAAELSYRLPADIIRLFRQTLSRGNKSLTIRSNMAL